MQDQNNKSRSELFCDVFSLTSNTLVNQVLIAGNFFVCSLALSHLESSEGNDGLVASGLLTPSVLMLFNGSTGFLKSTAIKSTLPYKQKKFEEVGGYFLPALVYCAMVTAVATSALFVLPLAYSAIGQRDSVVDITKDFLYIYALAFAANVFNETLRDYALAVNDPHSVYLSAMFSNIPSAFFGFLLTTGSLGFPNWGAKGYAAANAAFSWVTLLFYLLRVKFSAHYKILSLFECRESFKKDLCSLFKLGAPIGSMIFIERSIMFGLTILASKLGDSQLVALEINMQYLFFLIVPMYGFARGLGIVGKKHYQNKKNVSNAGKIGLLIATMLGIIFCIVYNTIPEKLVDAYSNKSLTNETLTASKNLFIINGVGGILEANRISMNGNLRAFNDTFFSFMTSLFIIVPSFGLSYALAFVTNLDVYGLMIGRYVGISFTLAAQLYRWNYRINDNEHPARVAHFFKNQSFCQCPRKGSKTIIDDSSSLLSHNQSSSGNSGGH